PSELEALRKENDLLKLNLQLVLEKVRAQEAELAALKVPKIHGASLVLTNTTPYSEAVDRVQEAQQFADRVFVRVELDAAHEVETALQTFQKAPDKESKRKAADALEKA